MSDDLDHRLAILRGVVARKLSRHSITGDQLNPSPAPHGEGSRLSISQRISAFARHLPWRWPH